jgi:hypothetical protein
LISFVKIFFLDNALLCEFTDRINNNLVSSMNEEIKTFYKHVFRHMYKAIAYVEVLTHLAQWPMFVQVN